MMVIGFTSAVKTNETGTELTATDIIVAVAGLAAEVIAITLGDGLLILIECM